MIALSASEKFTGGSRLEFLCGARALAGFHALGASVGASVRLLSVLPAELPEAIERVQADAKELRRQLKDMQARLAGHEGAALADQSEVVGSVRAVMAALDGYDANGLKTIANAIMARPGHIAVLLSAPPPSAVVVGRAPDVTIDSSAILKQLIAAFGGKGGGRPEMAQGGGLQGDVAAMLAAARAAISG
jgi:alanyl-tRNA synthetase